ncbi:Alpha/Beta hydrolase protein [Paraphoma chrysanthemicola]|uniref:Alpha/Beta hydrolase protein n=1 Tax=Paraphoma chrysanthemicola TaxID=798071 RepID=A0A8K0R0J2_9PLEO|nr:Alpha/Beta hydrolase protein [Paraphoma chrysanthemicola]
MDFSALGHPSQEWLSFLESNPQAALDGFTNNNPTHAAEFRHTSNQARSATSAALIAKTSLDQRVTMSTMHIPTETSYHIPLRIYRPTAPRENQLNGAVLYFHGGGFLLGDENTDDYLCCRVADETNTIVLSVIYRHTHKYSHPAQVDDAWSAYEYLRDNAASIEPAIQTSLVVMGISAGCTLAASVILQDLEFAEERAGYKSCISGAVLGIPWLVHVDNYPFDLFASREVAAKVQNKDAPVIPSARLEMFSSLLGADPKERLLNVPLLSDGELRGWPKTAMLVAGADPLRDDGLMFGKRLESLGVDTKMHTYPGLPHGFRRWPQLASTAEFDKNIVEGILWAAR